MTEPQPPVHVLLVEDDPGDVLMTREAFEHHKIRNPLSVVTDGAAAIDYLRRRGDYADAVRPGLIPAGPCPPNGIYRGQPLADSVPGSRRRVSTLAAWTDVESWCQNVPSPVVGRSMADGVSCPLIPWREHWSIRALDSPAGC